jgi:hypothetical protein
MKNLDDLFRERLHDAEVPPPAFVWPNVERELHKRRRRMFFWWFVVGAGLLSLVGLWRLSGSKAPAAVGLAQQESSARPPQNDEGKTDARADRAPERSPGAEQEAAEQLAGTPERPVFYPQKGEASGERDAHFLEKKGAASGGQDTRFLEKKSAASGERDAHFLEKKSTANTSTLSETGVDRAADESEDQQVEMTHVRASGGAAALSPSDARVSASSTAELAAGPAADETTVPENAATLAPPPEPTTGRGAFFSEKLPLTDYTLLALKRPAADRAFPHARANVRKKPNKYKNCYDFNTHPNVFLLDVYAGPSLVRKDLRPVSPEESWYRQRRAATERSDWAFNAGLRGTLLLNQHFLIRTGLHYDQVTEVFEYADPNYREVNIRQRSVLVNGTWVTVSDTTVSYGEHYTKTYNRLGMLDIPLQLGVEVRNRRSGVSLQAGASVNVLFWKRGDILSMTDQPASFDPKDDELAVFKARTGLSVSGSVQWFYHLKPRLRVFAEPYFRQVLRPVTLDAHPVEQRYGIGGIRLGLTKIMD